MQSPGTTDANDPEAANPHHCGDLFAPDLLPTFEIEISDADWAALHQEQADWQARQAQGLDLKPYHPLVSFKYGNESVSNVFIKLQANPSSSWIGDKLMFTISFNQIDKQARFHGLRKLLLHAQPSENTFIRERLSLSFMRLMDLPAACGNNARLMVNGSYYGIYFNREAPDDEFLQRVFGDDRGGDFWKSGYDLDNHPTPVDAPSHDALMAIKPGDSSDALRHLSDIDEVLAEWAAEAMLPDNDGYWAVDHNYYLYRHPTRGFLWVPYDMDATFDFSEFSADPITWVPFWSQGWGVHQQVAFADPDLRARYVAALQRAYDAYDVALLQARWQRWAAQIADSVAADQVKPFSTAVQQMAVASVNNYIPLRKTFVGAWLACYAKGGKDIDSDGDGFDWCHDCNDGDRNMNPNAQEICGNDVDENCNGRKDDCQ